MKSKFLQVRKMLLVAAGLLVGASAWAATETYNFAAHTGNFTYESSYLVYSTTNWGYKATDSWLNNRFSFEDGTSGGQHRNYWTVRTFSSGGSQTGLNNTNNTPRIFGIHNLKDGDVLVFTTSAIAIKSQTTNIKIENEDETLAQGTEIVSGTRYVVTTSDETTMVEILGPQYCCVSQIQIVTQESETMGAPTIAPTGANGGKRTVTITSGVGNGGSSATATYYTLDESDPTSSDTRISYTQPFIIEKTTTIKAVSYLNETVGEIATTVVEAGTTLPLTQPTFTLVNMKKGTDEAYYPVYEATSNNSNVIGQPTATFKYTFVPTTGSSTSGTLTNGVFAFPSQGTLTVTAEATGYDDSQSAEISVTSKYDLTKTYDFANPISTNLIDIAIWSVTAENVKWLNQDGKTGTGYSIAADAGINGTEMIEGLTMDGGSQGLAGLQIVEGYGLHLNADRGTAVVTPTFGDNELAIFTGTRNKVADITSTGQSYSFSRKADGNGLQKIDIYKVKVDAVPVTVTEAGFATYVNKDYDLDFSATDIEAYTVKVSTKGVATLTKVDEVPAGTPVLLYAEGGATEDIPVTTGAADVEGNDLVAGTGAAVATTDGAYTNMILNVVDEKIGFYFANNQNVAANRAYLHIATELAPDAASGARLSIIFDGETTGIAEVEKAGAENGAIYNLSGQRVSKPANGLYIVNGKKVIIK